jgi:ABC-2 type transport system ATP-binding protein
MGLRFVRAEGPLVPERTPFVDAARELDYRCDMAEQRPALEIAGLTVSRSGRRVLDRISFVAQAGEILAIVGPNGAGKTTLLEATVGLLPSQTERLLARGVPLRSFADRARTFAYMPDDARLPEEVSVRTLLRGLPVDRRLGVEPLLARRGGALSRGEAKRVSLGLALSLDRPVVVLDEPFGAFDPLQLDDVLEVVRACATSGAAVIVTVHQMSTAERIADRLVLVAGGRGVATGTLQELRTLAGGAEISFEEVFRRLLADREEHAPA